MKKRKRLGSAISMFLAIVMFMSLLLPSVTLTASAVENDGYVAHAKPQSEGFMVEHYSPSGNKGVYTKDFTITHPSYEGFKVEAYCMNLNAMWPEASGTQKWTLHDEVNTTAEFSQFLGNLNKPNYPRYSDNEEMKAAFSWVAWAGYPLNAMGLKEKYGLNDTMFKNVTQVAIWYFSDMMLTKDGKTYGILDENKIFYSKFEPNFGSAITDTIRNLNENEKNAIKELTLNGEKPSESKLLTPEVRENFNDINFGIFTNSNKDFQNMFSANWNPNPVRLKTEKVNEKGAPLSGAGFSLTKLDNPKIKIFESKYPNLSEDNTNAQVTWMSSSNEQNWILTKGKYRLEETTVPDGYSKLAPIEFEIKTDGSIIFKDGTSMELIKAYGFEKLPDTIEKDSIGLYYERPVFNRKLTVTNIDSSKTRISFSKTAINGTEELEGAGLKVVKGESADGTQVIDSWISASDKKILSLEKNQIYTMVETIAPAGYKVSESITFKVTVDGKLQIKEGEAFIDKENATVQMKDAFDDSAKQVKVSKVGLGGKEIAGARIIVTKVDEPSFKVAWTSGTEEKTLSLKPGEYTFHEESAPSGYKTVTDIKFTVDHTGKVTVNTAETTGEAKVEENGKLVITDTVYESTVETDGNSPKLSTMVKANASYATVASSAAIPANEAGTVLVSDTINYSGLVPNRAYTVTGKLYEVNGGQTAGEKAIITSTFISSLTGSGSWILNFGRVAGIENGRSYVVYEKAVSVEDLVDKNNDGTPDAKQEVTHENPDDVSQTFVVGKEAINSEKQEVSFSKTAVNGTNELPGAHLKVVKGESNDGEPVESWISTSTQKKIILGRNETYTMLETTAPDGYEVAESITFRITAEGKVQVKSGDSFVQSGDMAVRMQDKPQAPPEPPIPPTGKGVKYLIKKVEKGTNTILSGAVLELFKGEGTGGERIFEKTTDGMKIEGEFNAGIYTLSEKTAPSGYEKAENIVLKVEGGKLYFKKDGIFIEATELEEIGDNNYQAFADRLDDAFSWGTTPYGKHYYLRTDGQDGNYKGEVLYCFNIDLHEPPESYDNGENTDTFGDGEIRYTKIVNPNTLKDYTQNARIADNAEFYNKIQKVIYAGYPQNKKDIQGSLSATEFKTATQLAIYYYTDSIDLATVEHGFEGIRKEEGKKVKEVFDRIIAFAESNENVPDGFKINLFTSNSGKYQNLIGTEYTDNNLLYTIKMEDAKKLATREIEFSKVDIGGKELAGAKIEIYKGSEKIDSWMSEASGSHRLGVAPGTYRFKETAAPDGYVAVTDFDFTVEEDGKIKLGEIASGDTIIAEDGKVIVTDKAEPAVTKEVTFSKTEVNGTSELEGAKLKVEKFAGAGTASELIDEWTSTKTAKKITLGEGQYKMIETIAPDGYEIAESIIFRVTKDGKVEIQNGTNWIEAENSTIRMQDAKKPTPVEPPTPTEDGDIEPNPEGKIAIQKKWLGADGAETSWPAGAEIKVNIYKIGSNDIIKSVIIKSEEAVIVEGFEKGAKYRIEEAGTENSEIKIGDATYTVTVGGSTVKNIIKPAVPEDPKPTDEGDITPNDEGKIAVQKKWLDAKGNVVPWPEGVEIRVRVLKVNAGGNTLAKEIAIASSEAVIVDGLDKTAVYQVEEAGVTNGEIKIGDTSYTVTIGGSTVTNRANSPEPEIPPTPTDEGETITPNEKGKIAVQKKWLDAKGNVVPWPEGVEIRVRVLKVNADGNTLAKEITIASSEAVIVDGLDKTAVYQVEEAGVTNGEIKIGDTGYTVTIGGSTVTNRAKPVNEEPNNSDGDNPDNPGGDNPGNNDPDNPGGNRPDSPSETTPSKPNEADSGSRVNTGDKSNIAAYVILLASSFMLMTFVIVMKRTRGRKK